MHGTLPRREFSGAGSRKSGAAPRTRRLHQSSATIMMNYMPDLPPNQSKTIQILMPNDWTPPTSGCTSAEIPLKSIRRNKSKKSWRFPIREIAADDGASYSVRAHLRPQRNGLLEGGFSAGVDVEFLSNATEGKSRIVFAKDRISPDWAWYDIGEYDFSALQKIHRPTMDGLSLYIEGEVEVDKVEIAKVK